MNIDFRDLIKKNPFFLAPMDDVTDIAFRKLCEDLGSCYTITELTSIEALVRDKVLKSRYRRGNLKINVVQLFGSDVKTFVEAAKIVENEADIIDVNFGCPSPRVTGNDSGAALLQDPKNVGEIIRELVKNTNKPITAKIRLGYEKSTYLEVAKEIEKAGASLICVHGRTAKQKYTGKADWDAIKQVYDALSIPVIGNGDICCEEDIDKYLGSHCDALMIGRSAIGNPIIFQRFNKYFKTGEKLETEDIKKKQKELFLEYLEIIRKFEMHKIESKIQHQAMCFMKGIEGVKDLRAKLMKTKDITEIIELITKF